MITCPKCGTRNSDEAGFCGSCGAALTKAPGPSHERTPAVASSGQQVSLPIQFLVIGVVGLLAVVCLLVLIIVGLVGEWTSEGIRVVLDIIPSLIRLYCFLLALLGGYALVNKVDLSRIFVRATALTRFLLLVATAELLYLALSFISDRLFTFVSRGTHIAYSLERAAEAGFLLIVLAAIFWLLRRESE